MAPPPFELPALGPFSAGQVVTTLSDERMPMTAETRRLIAGAWARRSAESEAGGQLLFAGPLARLPGWSVADGALHLAFGRTDYRELVGTNLTHPEIAERFGADHLSDGTGVCTVIRTADARIVLQRRNGRVFEHPGSLHVCAGSLEPMSGGGRDGVDPFAMIRRQIGEEFAIGDGLIVDLRCLGLARSGRERKPELLMETTLGIDSTDMVGRSGPEHAELVAVADEPGAIGGYLSAHRQEIAPAGLACLTAYTACRFMASMTKGRRTIAERGY